MNLTGAQLIGSDESRLGIEHFHGIDPTTGKPLAGEFAEATTAEIDRALNAAASAFRPFRKLARERRAAFLEAIATQIEALGPTLLERAQAETALPQPRLLFERNRTTAQLRMFAQIVRDGAFLDPRIDRAQPDRAPVPKPDVRRTRIGLGPVVVFGASNFPLAFSVTGGDTAAALAAGCPVVVKAHPNHPGTSELAGRAILAAAAATDMPAGVFSLVQGRSHQTGKALVQHPKARAVAFTGSLAGGRALFDLAAARPDPIPVFAELGSINPFFVLPGALATNAEPLATQHFGALTVGVGQFCTNPGLVVAIDGPGLDTFQNKLAEQIDAARPGVMLHAGIARGYAGGLDRLESHGAQRLAGGNTAAEGPGHAQAAPALYRVAAARFLKTPALAEEVFGPSALLVVATSPAEMIAVAESLAGQLTATIRGGDADRALVAALVDILEERAGRVLFGGVPTGVEVCAAMQHGGPWPATTDSRTTSVGSAAIDRFLRPVAYQDAPAGFLPAELRD